MSSLVIELVFELTGSLLLLYSVMSFVGYEYGLEKTSQEEEQVTAGGDDDDDIGVDGSDD